MQLPNPGQWFQRRYELGELLGKGGFAAVYRAIDHDVGREVAIKILMPDHNGYEQGLVQRFMREGRIVAGLQDPNTITMYDFGRTEDDLLFMVFEYVPGSDLSKLLIRTGPMPEGTVVHILHQLLNALREAHGAGILHRDIKPANILVHTYMEDDRRVKLLDFGIAKPTMQEGEVDELEEGTKSGMSPGTPRYMSPEQIYGDELTAATDIFSLGLVAYEMLSGKPAVQGRTTKETLLNQLSDKPILLPPFLRVSPQLRRLVERMTLKRAADRPQNTQEVMREIAQMTNLSTSRALPRPQDRTKAPNQSAPLLSPAAKEKLGTVGLVALAVVVIAALAVPIVKVVKSLADKSPPPAPVRVQRPIVSAPVREVVEEPEQAPDEPAPKVLESGCGATPPFTGRGVLTHTMGVIDRRYVAYVPEAYDADREHPLVLLLHDERTPKVFLADSGFDTIANTKNAIVIVPNGNRGGTTWSAPRDAESLAALIDEVSTKFCVDRTKRFVVGHEASGEAAEALACEIPMSGVATTSYLPKRLEAPCKPIQPTPFIQIIGAGNVGTALSGKSECRPDMNSITWAQKSKLAYDRNDCEGEDIPWGGDKRAVCTTRACPEAAVVACVAKGAYEFTQVNTLPLGEGMFGNACKGEQTKFNVPAQIWHFFETQGMAVDPDAPRDL